MSDIVGDGIFMADFEAPGLTEAVAKLMEQVKTTGDQVHGAERSDWERTMNALTTLVQLLMRDFGEEFTYEDMCNGAMAMGGGFGSLLRFADPPVGEEVYVEVSTHFLRGIVATAKATVEGPKQ